MTRTVREFESLKKVKAVVPNSHTVICWVFPLSFCCWILPEALWCGGTQTSASFPAFTPGSLPIITLSWSRGEMPVYFVIMFIFNCLFWVCKRWRYQCQEPTLGTMNTVDEVRGGAYEPTVCRTLKDFLGSPDGVERGGIRKSVTSPAIIRESTWGEGGLGGKGWWNQGVLEGVASVEGGMGCRWENVISGITLEVSEMSGGWCVTDGVKVGDQGNSPCCFWGEREREQNRATEGMQVRDTSLTARGKAHSLKNDILDVVVREASSWEQMRFCFEISVMCNWIAIWQHRKAQYRYFQVCDPFTGNDCNVF